jgi:putative CocE/NonD family hydrolase
VIVEQGVSVPMRDGIVLRADVYRPEAGTACPALLLRTPYDRSVAMIPSSGIEPEPAVEAGYAVVCQDVRGLHGSDGEFYPFTYEGHDGYDSVEWIAAQPWCDGSVGMVGRSYAATCQWLAASEQPPHLKAICPVLTGSDFFRGWVYQGGAFHLGFNLFWVWMMSAKRGAPKAEQLFSHLPLRAVPLPDPAWGRFYFDWLAHPTDDDYWQSLSINRRYPRIEIPVLNVGGWFDVFLGGTLENFTRITREGGSAAAREDSRLIVGPWAHGSTYGPFPDHSFDIYEQRDEIDFLRCQLDFFDRHLRNAPVAAERESPVRIFVMGENRWRDVDSWPLTKARETPWFLRRDGVLDLQPPGDETPDAYTYDPSDPAPTVGGPTSLPAKMMRTNSGPLDQTRVEQRDDVVVYTSSALEAPVEVTGPISVILHASTSGRDTDFIAKLCDVWPDGRSLLLSEGVLRARFREGFAYEVLVEPERPYEYRIDLVATSNVFRAGHRIRVAITSSSFPRLDPNANTGAPLGTDGPDDLQAARQTIYHDSDRPSRLLLAVVGLD